MVGKVSQEQKYSMVKMRKDGYTVKRVAELYDVSTQCVLDHTVPGHLDRRKARIKVWHENQKKKRSWVTEEE